MPPDKDLIESALWVVRWQQGDRTAFDAILNRWEKSLFYYLRRLAPSEAVAWELLQDTWLKVLKSLRNLRDPRTLPAFLFRTARNTAISHLRRPEFSQRDALEDRATPDAQPDPTLDFQNAEQVHHALEQLPLLQREALTLFFLRELSLDEIALLLGVPLGTVKSRLHYARLSIQKILTKGDPHAS